jgi:DNA polymerase sigma
MFIQILEHYGIKFDYQRFYIKACAPKDFDNDTGMNMQEGQFFFDQGMHDLIIIDPLNHQNNVAKSTFQFMNIKMAFMIAFMVAKEDCECGCHYDILQNKMLGMEHCILKRIFNSVKRFSEANKNIY